MGWKSISSIVAGVVFVGFVVILVLFSAVPHEAKVSQTMVQMVLDYEIPRLKENHGIRATHAEIKFNDSANLLIELQGHRLGKQFTMLVSADGQPDITHSHNGEFYFKPNRIKVEHFEYSGRPPGEMLKRVGDRYFMKHPGIQNALNDAAPQVEHWMTVAAENGAVVFLNNVPVYKPQGDWGPIIGASIKQATVVGDHLEITYSLWALTSKVLIWIGSGVFCVVVFFAMLVFL